MATKTNKYVEGSQRHIKVRQDWFTELAPTEQKAITEFITLWKTGKVKGKLTCLDIARTIIEEAKLEKSEDHISRFVRRFKV